jgi:hypothetical protein
VASQLPNINPPFPIYSIVGSDDGIPLTIPSSWGEFSFAYDTTVSDFPVEPNGFMAYNKVRRPSQVFVQMTKTGSDIARFSWLEAIRQIEATNPTQMYTIVTPQGVYIDYTLAGFKYQTRPDRGSNILYLELQFTQVPQVPSSTGTYTDTASPANAALRDLGRLFTNTATAAQTALTNASSFITG